jgi:succinyl-diaminopimelate desuccinylase
VQHPADTSPEPDEPARSATVDLAAALVRRPSVTPEDHGCQALLIERLEGLGFDCRRLRYGVVDNFWARRGTAAPLLAFAGHTDVVPVGEASSWQHPPFAAQVHNGMLHGRGSADMKGSLAAMVTAIERFVAACPDHRGSIAMLVTSDEEGPAVDGTVRVVEHLTDRGERIDWCLVGEPSSTARLGDTVRIGRRGSLTGHLRVFGTGGHIAYPQLADNPIHRCLKALDMLARRQWDQGNASFPPTSFQISNFHAGQGTGNVIPGEARVQFNFRYCTETNAERLEGEVEALLREQGLRFEIEWRRFGDPFLTPGGALVEAVSESVEAITGQPPQRSTGGGTSDGRYIAPTGAQVVELGPVNATIHKTDEQVAVADLDALSRIYERVLYRLLA